MRGVGGVLFSLPFHPFSAETTTRLYVYIFFSLHSDRETGGPLNSMLGIWMEGKTEHVGGCGFCGTECCFLQHLFSNKIDSFCCSWKNMLTGNAVRRIKCEPIRTVNEKHFALLRQNIVGNVRRNLLDFGRRQWFKFW